jgi:hypothetical protein
MHRDHRNDGYLVTPCRGLDEGMYIIKLPEEIKFTEEEVEKFLNMVRKPTLIEKVNEIIVDLGDQLLSSQMIIKQFREAVKEIIDEPNLHIRICIDSAVGDNLYTLSWDKKYAIGKNYVPAIVKHFDDYMQERSKEFNVERAFNSIMAKFDTPHSSAQRMYSQIDGICKLMNVAVLNDSVEDLDTIVSEQEIIQASVSKTFKEESETLPAISVANPSNKEVHQIKVTKPIEKPIKKSSGASSSKLPENVPNVFSMKKSTNIMKNNQSVTTTKQKILSPSPKKQKGKSEKDSEDEQIDLHNSFDDEAYDSDEYDQYIENN